jgi:hypothetical protein
MSIAWGLPMGKQDLKRAITVAAAIGLVTGCQDGGEGTAGLAKARQAEWTREIVGLTQQRLVLSERLAAKTATRAPAPGRELAERAHAHALVEGSRQSLVDLERDVRQTVLGIEAVAARENAAASVLLNQESARINETLQMLRQQLASAERETARTKSN